MTSLKEQVNSLTRSVSNKESNTNEQIESTSNNNVPSREYDLALALHEEKSIAVHASLNHKQQLLQTQINGVQTSIVRKIIFLKKI